MLRASIHKGAHPGSPLGTETPSLCFHHSSSLSSVPKSLLQKHGHIHRASLHNASFR